jgi:mRNA-degrading endonuclease RelE of RelBE toxin-antitoxin system
MTEGEFDMTIIEAIPERDTALCAERSKGLVSGQVVIVETPSFLRDAKKLMNEGDRLALFSFPARNPVSGVRIRGTGGARKIRWARKGAGKSRGYRVIYFFHSKNARLFALKVFKKKRKTDIDQAERNELKEITSSIFSDLNTPSDTEGTDRAGLI